MRTILIPLSMMSPFFRLPGENDFYKQALPIIRRERLFLKQKGEKRRKFTSLALCN